MRSYFGNIHPETVARQRVISWTIDRRRDTPKARRSQLKVKGMTEKLKNSSFSLFSRSPHLPLSPSPALPLLLKRDAREIDTRLKTRFIEGFSLKLTPMGIAVSQKKRGGFTRFLVKPCKNSKPQKKHSASNHYLLMQKPRNDSSRRFECQWECDSLISKSR